MWLLYSLISKVLNLLSREFCLQWLFCLVGNWSVTLLLPGKLLGKIKQRPKNQGRFVETPKKLLEMHWITYETLKLLRDRSLVSI